MVGDNGSGLGTCVVGGGGSIRRGHNTRNGCNSESDGGSSAGDHRWDEGEFEGDSEEGSGEKSKEDRKGEEVDYEVKRVNAETSEFEYSMNRVNFSDDWNTWEPAESLPGCEEVLDKFEDNAMDFRMCL